MAVMLRSVIACLALAPHASASDSSCAVAGNHCPVLLDDDDTALVQVDTKLVSHLKPAHQVWLMHRKPSVTDIVGRITHGYAQKLSGELICSDVANVTQPLVSMLNSTLDDCSTSVDGVINETLAAQDVLLKSLQNKTGTASEKLTKFQELVNSSLAVDGKGSHLFYKLLAPLLARGAHGLEKSEYADVAAFVNDSLLDDTITWALRKSHSKVAHMSNITGAKAKTMIKELNATLEAGLARFGTLADTVNETLGGVTGGVDVFIASKTPPECVPVWSVPFKSVNKTKDDLVLKVKGTVTKLASGMREGMSAFASVLAKHSL